MEDVITGTSTFIITKHEMNTLTFLKTHISTTNNLVTEWPISFQSLPGHIDKKDNISVTMNVYRVLL